MKKIKILLPITAISIAVPFTQIVTGCSKKNENNFSNDSWENIAKYANQGIESLIEHYKPANGTFVITKADTAKERQQKIRKVSIEGLGTFDVVVVAEGSYTLAQSDNKVAALTFQFLDPVTELQFNESNQVNYGESYLRNYLNKDFFKKLPGALKQEIKSVNISAIGKQESIILHDKIFIPTNAEVSSTAMPDEKEIAELLPYYAMHNSSYYLRKKIDNNGCKYWTRKSYYDEFKKSNTYTCVDEDGNFLYVDDPNQKMGVLPCFSIGSNDKIRNVYLIGSNFKQKIYRFNDDVQKIEFDPSINSYKYSNGEEKSAYTLHKLDIELFNHKSVIDPQNYSIDDQNNVVVETNFLTSPNVYLAKKQCEIKLSINDIIELANVEESSEDNGDFISKYLNIGDFYHVSQDWRIKDQIEILDFCHDTYEKDGVSKKAAITFDYCQSQYIPETQIAMNSSNLPIRSYAQSDINELFSNDYIDYLSSVSKDLVDNLKICDKPIYEAIGNYDDNNWLVTNMKSKVWSLSAVETGISKSKFDLKYPLVSGRNFDDGYPYAFYLDGSGANLWDKSPTTNVVWSSWQLRTPLIDTTQTTYQYMHVQHEFSVWTLSSDSDHLGFDQLNPSFAI